MSDPPPDDEDDRGPDAGRRADDESSYDCGSCGETIVVPLDPTAGRRQRYVEDCPVCCAPHEIVVEFDPDGTARVTARREGS